MSAIVGFGPIGFHSQPALGKYAGVVVLVVLVVVDVLVVLVVVDVVLDAVVVDAVLDAVVVAVAAVWAVTGAVWESRRVRSAAANRAVSCSAAVGVVLVELVRVAVAVNVRALASTEVVADVDCDVVGWAEPASGVARSVRAGRGVLTRAEVAADDAAADADADDDDAADAAAAADDDAAARPRTGCAAAAAPGCATDETDESGSAVSARAVPAVQAAIARPIPHAADTASRRGTGTARVGAVFTRLSTPGETLASSARASGGHALGAGKWRMPVFECLIAPPECASAGISKAANITQDARRRHGKATGISIPTFGAVALP